MIVTINKNYYDFYLNPITINTEEIISLSEIGTDNLDSQYRQCVLSFNIKMRNGEDIRIIGQAIGFDKYKFTPPNEKWHQEFKDNFNKYQESEDCKEAIAKFEEKRKKILDLWSNNQSKIPII